MDEADTCMVFDELGNAFHCFDYTAKDLEQEARQLRHANGEISTVTLLPNAFDVWISPETH